MCHYLKRIACLCIVTSCLPAFSQPSSSLVIIIDDLGNNLSLGQRAINLPGALTYGILPSTPQAENLAAAVLKSGNDKEVIIHMPMESVYSQVDKTNAISANKKKFSAPNKTQTLASHQKQKIFVKNLHTALQQFPSARGLNNHQGSHLTALIDQMNWLMGELKETDLYFIDSKTTGNSVARKAAATHGIPYLVRDVFLDHDPSPEAIDRQYRRALKIAYKKGYAVIIAHPNRSTLDYLEQQIPLLAEKNVVIVSGSEAIRQQRQEIIERTKETLLSNAERQADPGPLGIH
ncbi:MAG: hypothetical protein CL691_04320 [Cellvibrionales bacterium]|nr:hypothetical protein [Cellvibrionales bacterium]|tara:strand:- start:18309 stop:19181 length:873 start_codon:yes stop_codon:yes gene_type:complete